MSSQAIFFTAILLFAIGAAGSLMLNKNNKLANIWGNSLALVGSSLGLVSSLSVLIFGSVFSYSVNSSLPFLSLSFSVDKLSAFFIFVISLISLAASIYAFGYV